MFYHLAKRIRNQRVLRYINKDDIHLDIGCGDGWLIDHSPTGCSQGIYAEAEHQLPIFNHGLYGGYFTKITLVAVLEHLIDPVLVLRECLRLLAPHGQIIITAPTILGQIFVPLVDHQAEREHKRIISYRYLRRIIPPEYDITRHFFEFWLNQIFIIERR